MNRPTRRPAPPRFRVPFVLVSRARRAKVVRWQGRALQAVLALAISVWAASPAWGQARTYVVDPHASSVRMLLGRAGPFSVLAHDHVLVADGFAGRITVDRAASANAALQVTFPVGSLVVDPPEVRAELGLDGDVDEADRAEIKAAMLAEDQLHAEQYPRIVATLDSVQGRLPELVLALRVRIRQAEQVITMPARVTFTAEGLEARGEFTLVQSAFDIEPYTALLGAIAVQDEVTVRYRIVARAESG